MIRTTVSSAAFTITADETATVYQTGSGLVPGAVEAVEVNMAKPYRITIQAWNTSPEGLLAYPAIGIPQLLCTGL